MATTNISIDHPEEPHVFALAGLVGCGKSTAATMMVSELEHSFERAQAHEVSDFCRTLYEREHGGQSPPNDNELGNWTASVRDEYGDDYIVREMCSHITASHPPAPHLVISGLRSPAGAEAVREFFGEEHTSIVALWTLPDLRFERKYGDSPSSDHPMWEDFQERNERETWEWRCVDYFTEPPLADYIVENNGGVENLERAMSRIAKYEGIRIGGDRVCSEPEEYRGTPFPEDLDDERVAQYL